jgi:hypothetical protein
MSTRTSAAIAFRAKRPHGAAHGHDRKQAIAIATDDRPPAVMARLRCMESATTSGRRNI